jgi:hypothetical protein
MAVRFGVFVPQGWRIALAEIEDPIEQYETMTRVARVVERVTGSSQRGCRWYIWRYFELWQRVVVSEGVGTG